MAENDYEKVGREYKIAQEIDDYLSQRSQDDRTEIKERAKGKLRKIGHDYAVAKGFIDGDRVGPRDIEERNLLEFLKGAQRETLTNSANRLYDNLESIVDELPESKLEDLIKSDDVLKFTEGNERKVLASYRFYKDIESFARRYQDSGEIRDEKERKLVEQASKAGEGIYLEEQRKKAMDAEIERQKEEGYSVVDEDLTNLAGNLMVISVKSGYSASPEERIKEYTVKALSETAGELKKAYENLTEESGIDAKGAVKATLKRLGRKGSSTNDFKTMAKLIYDLPSGE
ncbi:MAG: hypothetical protein IIA87_01615 [Nanoarchaeota archaeon]|nr:hypothetical protein [Nanoarchaeota archaeon]